jgi:hypothetical protein
MITVANRATPRPLTLEQQKAAMTSEGAPPAGEMPGSAPKAARPATRPILHLPPTTPGAPDADKA